MKIRTGISLIVIALIGIFSVYQNYKIFFLEGIITRQSSYINKINIDTTQYGEHCLTGKLLPNEPKQFNVIAGIAAGHDLSKGSCEFFMGPYSGEHVTDEDYQMSFTAKNGKEYLHCDLKKKVCVFKK